jgi:uncharacterized membrane protein HdeD (DUF308 family)
MFTPGLPNPLNDETEHERRLAGRDFTRSGYWRWVCIGGVVVLAVFGVLALAGLPGTGLILVPVGLFMIIGGGIQLLLERD